MTDTTETTECPRQIVSADYSNGFKCGKPMPCADHPAAWTPCAEDRCPECGDFCRRSPAGTTMPCAGGDA